MNKYNGSFSYCHHLSILKEHRPKQRQIPIVKSECSLNLFYALGRMLRGSGFKILPPVFCSHFKSMHSFSECLSLIKMAGLIGGWLYWYKSVQCPRIMSV